MNQRIIKFRAFLGVDKVMVGVNEIDFEHKTFSFIHPEYGAARHTIGGDGDVLMQFTGLHDKNGKEIYEGDIVTVKYNDGSGYDNPVEISFEKGIFWVGMGYLDDIKIIEVIGNIYESPSLLKGQKQQ